MQEQTCQDKTLEMVDEQTVERVARAMADADAHVLDSLPPYIAGAYRRRARAAIAAMPAREVTVQEAARVLGPDQWGWWAGCNEECLTVGPCPTRQHAVDEMVDDGSGEYLDETQDPPVWMNSFHIVEARQDPLRLADWIDLDWILNRADEALANSDMVSCEYDDGPWFEATKEQELDLADRLKRACDEWQIAHVLKFTSNTFSHSRNSETVNTPLLRTISGDKP